MFQTKVVEKIKNHNFFVFSNFFSENLSFMR